MAAKSVTVWAEDCRRLTAHHPRPDVAYRSGVDVHGKPVVPADLEDRSAWTEGLKKGFTMTLAIDPYDRMGRAAPNGLADSSVPIGKLSYDIGTGRMELDGRPLTDPQQAALSEACRARGL
ncbi:hypothetical protein [Rhodospirillum sp. A1_3_36]|uniref:hypothetical protein n=1 Tax=Rhodospirillum sp. A1_3_36 TaxID=3391666 RepID=UPI0039A4406C